ncbi:MAG: metallophosphoesterase [Candidatus Heimdallarchaeota archaeon]|nr:metallophosphoesterase [Candidatus Heimdallarchaeota archaeon]
MKILALSDTHGNFSSINGLVDKHQADVVLHCGDVSFLNYQHLDQYPSRELALNIKHWHAVPDDIRKRVWDMSKDEKIEIIHKYKVMGDLDDYIAGKKEFNVPIHVIWGNHENNQLIRKFLKKEIVIPNFNLLTFEGVEIADKLSIFGIGGNFSLKHFYKKPFSDEFYPFMSFEEWARVTTHIKRARKKYHNIWMMTHVSPGKEPVLEQFSTRLKPQLWFSGHMGAPLPQQYSSFTLFDDYELHDRLKYHVEFARKMLLKNLTSWKRLVRDIAIINETTTPDLSKLEILELLPEYNGEEKYMNMLYSIYHAKFHDREIDPPYPSKESYSIMKGTEYLLDIVVEPEEITVDNYFGRKRAAVVKQTNYINLPDVPDGYVTLESDNMKQFDIVSYGRI